MQACACGRAPPAVSGWRALAPYNAPMHILIANDDGYLAPGLAALVRACEGLGHIDVIAPEQNASGTSNSLTLGRPLTVFRAEGEAQRGFLVVNGTPSDCVHIALTGLLPQEEEATNEDLALRPRPAVTMLPTPIAAVLDRALAFDPAQRWRSVAELVAAFDAAISQ